jgi:quercetin dioxygenase-like cupin family protein
MPEGLLFPSYHEAVEGRHENPVVDLRREGRGPLWGTATEDLNATLLAWGPGEGVAEHVNDERDVLLVVLAGSGTVALDGVDHVLRAEHALILPKHARRSITAGDGGIRYLTVHLRRPALQLGRFAHAPEA